MTKNGEVAQRLFVHENRCLSAQEDRRMKARRGNGITVDSAVAGRADFQMGAGKSARLPEKWVSIHVKTVLGNSFELV